MPEETSGFCAVVLTSAGVRAHLLWEFLQYVVTALVAVFHCYYFHDIEMKRPPNNRGPVGERLMPWRSA